MDSSKLTALLFISMLSLSTIPHTLACNYCPKSPPTKKSPTPPPPSGGGLPIPPITMPPIISKPPFKLPPFKMPPVGLPPLPPLGLPPLPIIGGSTPPTPSTPPPPKSSCFRPPPPAASCPIDALKFGACLDVLGQTVQVGDPTVECCPVLDGLVGVAAAACLCTAIKAKLLSVDLVLPIALKVIVACGASVPAGYTCA